MNRDICEDYINKKWISELINKYIGRSDFEKLYPFELFRDVRVVGTYEKNILHDTRFGKSLKEKQDMKETVFKKPLPLHGKRNCLIF